MALAALNTGKRSASQVIMDGGSFSFGNHVFRSHGDRGLGAVDMYRSIVKSSNVYYYSLANELGVDLMHDQMAPLGFGRKTGIDLQNESTGICRPPRGSAATTSARSSRSGMPARPSRWASARATTPSRMLQLASATATLVSGGQRFKPRLVREIEDVVTHERRRIASDALEPLPYKPEHIALLLRAMHGVTQEGTSTRVFAGAPYKSGGKTGTAQAVGVKANQKYDASKLEEHKRDHSLYIAVAPLPDPTLVVAVIVENAGFGAAAAAPIARRVFDFVLLGHYPSEEDVAATRKGQSAAPIGAPRQIADVPLPGQLLTAPPLAIAPAPAASAASAAAATVAIGTGTGTDIAARAAVAALGVAGRTP
jgi:penicillin-binding protein 2